MQTRRNANADAEANRIRTKNNMRPPPSIRLGGIINITPNRDTYVLLVNTLKQNTRFGGLHFCTKVVFFSLRIYGMDCRICGNNGSIVGKAHDTRDNKINLTWEYPKVSIAATEVLPCYKWVCQIVGFKGFI